MFLWKFFASKTCVSLLPILKNTIPGFICRWSRDAACETIGELDVPLKAARVSWSFFRRGTPRLAAFFFSLERQHLFSCSAPSPALCKCRPMGVPFITRGMAAGLQQRSQNNSAARNFRGATKSAALRARKAISGEHLRGGVNTRLYLHHLLHSFRVGYCDIDRVSAQSVDAYIGTQPLNSAFPA